MYRILIVNNNLQIGGIQKSLINFLKEYQNDYDITLLLFSDYGALFKEIPRKVKVQFADKHINLLGTPWRAIKKNPQNIIDKIISKLILIIFGKDAALNFIFRKQKMISGYDAVISYSHCTSDKAIFVCTPEFVLKRTKTRNRICFIHCDYEHSDTCSKRNNDIYMSFDSIVCCSESVKATFLKLLPQAMNKTYVIRNFIDRSINDKANDNAYMYDIRYINVVSISRLSEEKGIFHAIQIIAESGRDDLRYYIVGCGPQEKEIKDFVKQRGLSERIILLGEHNNPYRYMINADYLLVPSRHEAAPMVFDEANILGLTVISTNTTSAKEMLTVYDYVVEDITVDLIKNLTKSIGKKMMTIDYDMYKAVFKEIIGDNCEKRII